MQPNLKRQFVALTSTIALCVLAAGCHGVSVKPEQCSNDCLAVHKTLDHCKISLAVCRKKVEGHEAKYNRKAFKHWTDDDGNCLNTRHDMLADSSLETPAVLDCKVQSGHWFDPYSGETYTDPKKLDIDHIVPLSNAFHSGARHWSKEQKRTFANDPENLIPVLARENRSKGKKSPDQWLPSDEAFHCQYGELWMSIKAKYDLMLTAAEASTLIDLARDCKE